MRTSGSLGFALVHSGCRRVHWASSGFNWALLVVAGFIRVPVGSLWRALWSPGSFEYAYVHSNAPLDRRVHSSSRGFAGARLGIVVFIRVGVGSHVRSPGSLRFLWFHSGAALVYLCARGFTQGFEGFALFIGFPVGSHGRSKGSPDSLGFTLALLKVTKFIRFSAR